MRNLVLAALLCFSVVGCSGPGSNVSSHTKVMRSLDAVAEMVKRSMNVYGVKFRAGQLSPKQIADVRDAYAKYQSVMNAAVFAADLNTGAPASVKVEEAAAVIVNLINTF